MNEEKGTVVQVTPLQNISDKFRKQEFTIKTWTEYPQFLTFQTVNDKCDLVRNLNPGDDVEVKYNLRGREWISPENVTKYFNTVEAWSIKLIGKPVQETLIENENDNDLPF